MSTVVPYDVHLASVAARPGIVRRLLRRPTAVGSLALLVLIALAAAVAPLIAPYSPIELGTGDRFLGPSAAHWFGTDELGRDLFSRTLYAGRYALGIAVAATLVATALGLAWGFVAAMSRGWVDELLMRLADVGMAIPQILLGLVLAAAFGASAVNLAVIIGLILAPPTARLMRSTALTELESEYCLAAVASGASKRRILFSEVLPNTMPTLIVQGSLNAASAILTEAALSFVGLGIQPPSASWGTLVQQGYQNLNQNLWYVTFPGIMIFASIWLLNIFADQLQDALDPRRTQ